MSELVRIGCRSLRPVRNEGRWSEEQPGWCVNAYYGYIEADKWEKVVDYQTVPEVPAGIKLLMRLGGSIEEVLATPYGTEMKRKMALGGNRTLWEMNIFVDPICRDAFEYIPAVDMLRTIAVFGEQFLVPWSWFRAFVALPVARLLARIMTKLDI